ncbi:MAG: cyclic nucleotide-binding domain-containing protein [Planctomycetes bacterium]|nr:cyclic nucleotide-binding domain-containing protein [Planctomycetota bacterium]
MTRKIRIKTVEVHDCPIYRGGNALLMSLPEIVMEETDAICAIAVADVLPWAIKVAAGGEVPERPLLCRGCRGGRAQASFQLEAITAPVTGRTTLRMSSLRAIPMFATLPERQLEKLAPMLQAVDYPAGADVITFGQPGEALTVIKSGEVEVLKPDDDGNEKLLGILKAGECFGEMSLLTGDPCSATIRVRGEPVRGLSISKRDFDALLGRNPELSRYFSKLLAFRLNRTSNQFTDQTDGVHGDLTMIGPAELVQAITVTDRSGTLEIQRDDGVELVFTFGSGQIWRIEAPGDPLECFYDFLRWTRGRFRFDPIEGEPEIERTIHKDTTSLLLEGMRRMDEADPVSS